MNVYAAYGNKYEENDNALQTFYSLTGDHSLTSS